MLTQRQADAAFVIDFAEDVYSFDDVSDRDKVRKIDASVKETVSNALNTPGEGRVLPLSQELVCARPRNPEHNRGDYCWTVILHQARPNQARNPGFTDRTRTGVPPP